MRHAPDPRVLLDVAAVQLTADSVAPDIGGLLARLHRLEEQVAAGVPVAASAASAPAASATAPPVTTSGRAVLGGRARAADEAAPVAATAAPPASSASTPPPEAAVASVADTPLTAEQWEQTVRPGLRGMARAVYMPATLSTSTVDMVTFSLPNAVHREKCEQHRAAVEAAVRSVTGRPTEVALIIEGDSGPAVSTPPAATSATPPPSRPVATADGPDAAPAPAGSPAATPPPVRAEAPRAAVVHEEPVRAPIDDPIDDDDVDLDDLVDVPPESVKSPIERLAEAFPGSEMIDERT
jgi:DNA polymerase-3 subunit gamma/tau